MERKTLVLCDAETDYAQQMASFLEKDREFPWEIVVSTGLTELKQMLSRKKVEIVLIAESLVEDALPEYSVKQIALLNESGRIRFGEVKNIDKYQAADLVRKELLTMYAEQMQVTYPMLEKCRQAACIAFYSPIRRCMQTSTAITFSQIMAEKFRVLYLNFESFAHFLLMDEGGMDLTSLVYHIQASEEEFALQLRSIKRTIGNWEYIVPMHNGENIPQISAEDWQNLLKKCKAMEEYDFIVLDLQDGMQGVFEILSLSDKIYTFEKGDMNAQKKIEWYKYVLRKKGYEDILHKTKWLQTPAVEKLPQELEDYSRGSLADYVRKEMMKDREGG